ALAGFARDGLNQLVGCVPIDEFLERRAAIHARTEDRAQSPGLQNVLTGSVGVDLRQLMIPGGPEKGIGRDQSAGAHAGHHRELWALPGLRHADDGARAESASGASAGQREYIDGLIRSTRPKPGRDLPGVELRVAAVGAEGTYAHRQIVRR